MQEAAWSRRVHYETGSNCEPSAVACAFNLANSTGGEAVERDLIVEAGSQPLRFVHEKVIEIGAVPVRVGNLVVRAGCHQELIVAAAGGDLGIAALPGPPLGQRQEAGQVVARRQLFQ